MADRLPIHEVVVNIGVRHRAVREAAERHMNALIWDEREMLLDVIRVLARDIEHKDRVIAKLIAPPIEPHSPAAAEEKHGR